MYLNTVAFIIPLLLIFRPSFAAAVPNRKQPNLLAHFKREGQLICIAGQTDFICNDNCVAAGYSEGVCDSKYVTVPASIPLGSFTDTFFFQLRMRMLR